MPICERGRGGGSMMWWRALVCFFFFQAEDGIRDLTVTGVQTCALPIYGNSAGTGGAHGCAGREQRKMSAGGAGGWSEGYVWVDGGGGPVPMAGRSGEQIGRASCRERV